MQGPRKVKYLLEDVDRHGNVRVYFRRRGKWTRINETLWSAEFWGKYHELLRLWKAGELQRGAQPGGVAERSRTKKGAEQELKHKIAAPTDGDRGGCHSPVLGPGSRRIATSVPRAWPGKTVRSGRRAKFIEQSKR